MLIRNCILHFIHKQPDGIPARLHLRSSALPQSTVLKRLIEDLGESYMQTLGKTWGVFKSDQSTYPLSRWLQEYIDGDIDFAGFSQASVEHLSKLISESTASTGGHVIFAHCVQSKTEYLCIAFLQHSDEVIVTEDLEVEQSKRVDLSLLNMAARIDLSRWQTDSGFKHYISLINEKTQTNYFPDFIGCEPGIHHSIESRARPISTGERHE